MANLQSALAPRWKNESKREFLWGSHRERGTTEISIKL